MKTKKQQVLDAVIELYNKELPATNDTVAKHTGFAKSAVNDCLKELADDEFICRIASGLYAPITQHAPARQIWKCTLPDGTIKFEIGDTVLTLTPKEARELGKNLLAESLEYGNIQLSHQFAELNNALHNRVKALERLAKQPQLPLQD